MNMIFSLTRRNVNLSNMVNSIMYARHGVHIGHSIGPATSPVNLWFDLDKIATETLFVGTDSHTHPEQHIKNIEQSK